MNQLLPLIKLKCPVCSGATFRDFFHAKNVPAQDGVVWPTRELALQAPSGDVILSFCNQCAYIVNRTYDAQKIKFTDYDFSLHYSNVYNQFNQSQIKTLIKKHELNHKTVMDVACGKGHFLVELCEAGDNQGYGIDPSFEAVEDLIYDPQQIEFIQDYYGEKYTNLKVDFISCRHLIDELAFPLEFLKMFRQNLRGKAGIYLEVPNALKTFSKSLIWNIGYGKRSWFLPQSITNLLRLAGYKNIVVTEVLEGDYLDIEAYADFSGSRVELEFKQETIQEIENFSQTYERELKEWKLRQQSWADGQQLALWGAGMRGINFLGHFADLENLSLVIDVNPLRQGKYLPKSGFLVSAPEVLKNHKIDLILISNATYQQEIMEQARSLGYAGGFVVF